MDAHEHRLLNEFQHDLPLCPMPFAHMADKLNVEETDVICNLQRLQSQGKVSRVGAVFRPNSINASTLAAMRVPAERLDEVAAMVSAHSGVSHNYARDYPWNLWFVVAARNETALDHLLDELQAHCGCPLLRLPLVESYHIDLGFDINADFERGATESSARLARQATVSLRENHTPTMSERDLALADALSEGLPLVPRPWAEIAARLAISEASAIDSATRWLADGVISRFGVIVRHHELGYKANAMVAFDVPDDIATQVGLSIALYPPVTLSARRVRSLPDWPYNVYCMIHGCDHQRVLNQIEELREHCDLKHHPFAVLFSRQRFKQQAARIAAGAAHG